MSSFEDFVQLELPKRPYLQSDVSQETVIVRRGPGPRQLAAVTLTEGQVLGMSGGVLTGVSNAALRAAAVEFAIADQTWDIPHGLNSENAIVQAFDAAGYVIIPDTIQVVDGDNITLTFNTPQTGVARVVFLD